MGFNRSIRGEMNQRAFEVPAAVNLAHLLKNVGHPDADKLRIEVLRRLENPGWADLDGVMLPMPYSSEAVARSLSLGEAVRTGSPEPFVATLRTQAQRALVGSISPD